MAGTPTGASTLLEALEALRAAGYSGDLFVTDDGRVRCGSCRHEIEPAELELDHLIRLEGVSDPSEMAAVLGVTCPECGAKGSVVVRYGPEATPGEADLLRAVEDRRGA